MRARGVHFDRTLYATEQEQTWLDFSTCQHVGAAGMQAAELDIGI